MTLASIPLELKLPNAMSDAQLALQLSAQPEPSAELRAQLEAELCARFAPRVRFYGLRHLGSDAAAADLVQDVLSLTLAKLRSSELRDPSKVASFVLGAARIIARDSRRRERRTSHSEPDAPELPADAAAGSTESAFDRERLMGCVGGLGERERSVVLLTFFEDQNAQEIASALGLQAGNVRVVRSRAIQRLRDCLGVAEPAP